MFVAKTASSHDATSPIVCADLRHDQHKPKLGKIDPSQLLIENGYLLLLLFCFSK